MDDVMKTLVSNLRGRCLFDVAMKTQIDGLISIQTGEVNDSCLEKFVKGGIVRIDTQDPIEAARRISEVIRGARKHGEVYVASDGDGLGGILSFVAHREGVDAIYTCFGESAVRLPPLKMDISDTKLRILEALEEESLNAVLLSRKVGISRAMVYKHLSALMDMGLVKQSQMFERYSITGAGKLVII
ncbi:MULTISPECIES: ArsR family transcriptional regulator [Methanothermobacter]|jgi:DNA-binding transcriptional ArsR family regulator|uniref:Conserved protein n=3 Tax=Methanothermobacter TaxID=145260 RepID=O26210_METTH|nr:MULTISPECIES: ArsR family transcriptional regulator [Methanothermobacter]AAB84613.1 conserved protein [Methanothermobacter thermautotrophicus str. Delta H]MDK2874639.1 hypothetical protein [Methanothermobacter sp.]REE25257.1 regulatory ArsR family protein [Methanothermobacter defluvii]HOQ17969.1 ArsR family transcriptional regulator [Methanothermobacter thermautotrophicus]